MSEERYSATPHGEVILDLARATYILPWILFDHEGDVADASPAAAELVSEEPGRLVGRSVESLLGATEAATVRATLAGAHSPHEGERPLNLVTEEGERVSLLARVEPCAEGALVVGRTADPGDRRAHEQLYELSNEMAVLARENKRQAKELAEALAERDRSYWHLRRIQEVLPICMDCGTVKPGSDWMSVVDYLRENSVFLSHGVCPDCVERRKRELRSSG